MDLTKFQDDVNTMIKKLSKNLKGHDISRLESVGLQLNGLYQKNLVKLITRYWN